jgi:hypothetical protein
MKTQINIVLTTCFLAFAFAGNSHAMQKNKLISPEIKYEFSGGAGHYNYAPSVIQDKYGIRYAFVCQNRDAFKIVDFIYLFKGIPTKEGYKWQPGTMIVQPSDCGWDDCHICDPDVREFKTVYKNETYNWIMTYLGVDRWDCKHNQIGLAISKNIEGPYIKFDQNPIITYQDTTKWGVGQSTTIVIDSVTVRIFYTSSNVGFAFRDIKLNDLQNIKFGEEKNIPGMDINNYPAASTKNMYMVSERREKSADIKMIPTWVGNVSKLRYIPIGQNLSTPDKDWIEIGQVGPKESGFPRNHNPGILTDTKGYMLNDDELIMFFTPAVTGEDWLWSYDIYTARFDLIKYFKK